MKRRHFLASLAAGTTTLGEAKPAPAERSPLRFGLVTDTQYADAEPNGERHYRASPEKLRRAVESIRAAKPGFTLHLGDLIDRDFRSFDVVLPILNELGHPVHHLAGNHDFQVDDADKPRVIGKLGMPHDYYCFRSSGIRFVMLDTNSLSIYKHPADSPRTAAAKQRLSELEKLGHPGAKAWNGGIDDAQLAWLDRALADATAAGERAIICTHHPILPSGPHQIWNPEALLAVLDRHHCVIACFSGHDHTGHFTERRGIPFITFRSLLHEPEISAFALIDIHPDRIVITGHGREASRVLPLPPSAP